MPIVGPLRVPSGQNPNWPLIDEAVSFPSGPNSPMPAPYWCSMIARSEGQWSATRGRQYELDQYQALTVGTTWENTDGALDPANTASPFYPQVTLYRAYRRRAQYPATVNLLTADQATVFYSAKGAYTGSTLPQWVGSVTGSTVTIGNAGSFNYYSTSAALAYNTVAFYGFSVTPGLAYSGQCEANCSTGVTAEIALRFVDVNGNTLTTVGGGTTTSASGAVITVTGTAPATAAGAVLYVQNNAAMGGGAVFNVWNVQVEQNTAASAFVTPGAWYNLATGYVTAWPETYDDGGMYAIVNPTVTDAVGYLSQRPIKSPAYMELLQQGCNFLYPLDESAGSVFRDMTANLQPVGFANLLQAASSTSTAGASLKNTGGAGTYLPEGIPGPVATCLGDVIDLTQRGVAGVPQSGVWTRVFAFQLTQTLAYNASVTVWYAGQPYVLVASTNLWLTVSNTGLSGGYSVGLSADGNLQSFAFPNLIYPGGGWHLVVLTSNADLTTVGWLDGVSSGASVGPLGQPNSGFDYVGDPSSGIQVALVAELPTEITSTEADLIYSAFRYGGSGDGVATSATRAADVLRWGGWKGASNITATPGTTDYGPGTDLLATSGANGTDVVSALQTVVDTENGDMFAAGDGTVTFRSRDACYNADTPAFILGEDTTAGEIPYTTVTPNFDPARVANDIQLTQTTTNSATRLFDTTSVDAFGDIQLQRNVNTLDSYEMHDAAQFLLARHKDPLPRIEAVTVDLAATNAWAMLGLELGQVVRVMRRPPAPYPARQFDGFVEQVALAFDDQGTASITLQLSDASGLTYWQLDSATFSVLGSTTIVGY